MKKELTYDAGWGRADSTRVGQVHTRLASRRVMQGEAGRGRRNRAEAIHNILF